MIELLPHLLRGTGVTIEVFVLSALVATIVALPLALSRMAAEPMLRWPAVAIIEFWRGSSALVQLFWLFYVLPLFGVTLPPLLTAVLGLGLNASAYGAEIIRAALVALPQGQRDAAQALGLKRSVVLLRVLLPQAFVAILPTWGNLMVELLKSTALVSLITLTDLTFAGQEMITTTGRTTGTWLMVLVIYYALALPIGWGMRGLERQAVRRWSHA